MARAGSPARTLRAASSRSLGVIVGVLLRAVEVHGRARRLGDGCLSGRLAAALPLGLGSLLLDRFLSGRGLGFRRRLLGGLACESGVPRLPLAVLVNRHPVYLRACASTPPTR